jgi:hypothetical protein
MDILGFKPRVLNILEVSPLCCEILNSRVWQAKEFTLNCSCGWIVQVVPWYWSVEIKQSLARVKHKPLLILGLVNEPLTSDCCGIWWQGSMTRKSFLLLGQTNYYSFLPVLFLCTFSAVPLSLLEANQVLHMTSNQPSKTMEKNQTLSLTGN